MADGGELPAWAFQLADRLAVWRADPRIFVRELFGVTPDLWQDEVLGAFPHTRRQAMKACKGPGKTAVLAWLSWNFLLTRPHPKIAATSITGDNLRDGLWTEMSKWQGRSPLLKEMFIWGKERIESRQHGETWWMVARSWSKTADATQQADALAGLHADYIMFVLDEAGGIPDAVMAAAEAALSGEHGDGKGEAHLLMAGNPTRLEGPLYRATTTERALWSVTEITGDPDDPRRASRVDVTWAREQIVKYGVDNPWVLINVFGRFPPGSLDALLGPDDVAAAIRRWPELPRGAHEHMARVLGVDVARFGGARSVIFPRQGLKAFPPIILRSQDSFQVAGRTAAEWSSFGAGACFVDGTGGWGGGVIDALKTMQRDPVDVQFSGAPLNDRFLNKRAEMWWDLAEWVKGGGALPPDVPDLVGELTTPTYFYAKSGKIQIEAKEQVEARLQRSPDLADALALTFAYPVAPPISGARGETRYSRDRARNRGRSAWGA